MKDIKQVMKEHDITKHDIIKAAIDIIFWIAWGLIMFFHY